MTGSTLSSNSFRPNLFPASLFRPGLPQPSLRGCALPKDHAHALAIVPAALANSLRTFFSRWHWTLECTDSLESGLALATSRPAAVVFCEASRWREVLEAACQLEHPPLVLVLAHEPKEREWVEVLTAGAFYLEANPLRTTILFPLLNHAWSVWNQHQANT